MSCIGMPTTKMFICGIVRARMPSATLTSKMANVTGIATFMPVRKMPLTKFTMIIESDRFGCIVRIGTMRKLSASAVIIM